MESKGVTFVRNDKDLIEAITKYQHKNELPSFVEAVRRLCKLALKVEEMREEK